MKFYRMVGLALCVDVALSAAFPQTYKGVTAALWSRMEVLDGWMASKLDGRDAYDTFAEELFPNLAKGGK
jgi:hypothetical protein